jgi:hypothetical protein
MSNPLSGYRGMIILDCKDIKNLKQKIKIGKNFFWCVIERVRVFRKAPHLVPKVQGPPGPIINQNLTKCQI